MYSVFTNTCMKYFIRTHKRISRKFTSDLNTFKQENNRFDVYDQLLWKMTRSHRMYLFLLVDGTIDSSISWNYGESKILCLSKRRECIWLTVRYCIFTYNSWICNFSVTFREMYVQGKVGLRVHKFYDSHNNLLLDTKYRYYDCP